MRKLHPECSTTIRSEPTGGARSTLTPVLPESQLTVERETLSDTQVLRLLEDMGLPELVVQLASLAVTEAGGGAVRQVRGDGQTPAGSDGKLLMCVCVCRPLCGQGCSSTIWTWDTTARPMKL